MCPKSISSTICLSVESASFLGLEVLECHPRTAYTKETSLRLVLTQCLRSLPIPWMRFNPAPSNVASTHRPAKASRERSSILKTSFTLIVTVQNSQATIQHSLSMFDSRASLNIRQEKTRNAIHPLMPDNDKRLKPEWSHCKKSTIKHQQGHTEL